MQCKWFHTYTRVIATSILNEDYILKMKRFPRIFTVRVTAGGLVGLEKPVGSVYIVLIAEWLYTGKLGYWMNFMSLNEEFFFS